MLNPEQRADLRRAIRTLSPHVLELIQDRIRANHEAARPRAAQPDKPFTPLSLEQVTYNSGVADGMAELWAELTTWSEEPK